MSFKHSEEQRKKWREYYRQNREQVIARVSSYNKEHRRTISQREKNSEEAYKEKIIAFFGTKCKLCGFDGGQALKRIQMHERNGDKHHRGYGYVWRHKEDFEMVCISCHQIVHHLMLRFELSWEEIARKLKVA